MDFLDGFELALELMQELHFSQQEIHSRREWMKWVFWNPNLCERARVHCADKFLLKYHRHTDWMAVISLDSMIWVEGMNMSIMSAHTPRSSSSRPAFSSPKRKKRSGKIKPSLDRRDAPAASTSGEARAPRPPLKDRIIGVCDSRVSKDVRCRHERDGGDGKRCRYSHICPRCPNEDHAANVCGKM